MHRITGNSGSLLVAQHWKLICGSRLMRPFETRVEFHRVRRPTSSEIRRLLNGVVTWAEHRHLPAYAM